MQHRLTFVAVLAAAAAMLLAVPAQARTDRAGASQAREALIVVLKPSAGQARAVAAEHARRFGLEVTHVYEHALHGYAAAAPGLAIAALAADARVDFVERDAVVTADDTQSNPPWGLDRIDQRSRPLSGTYTYSNTGAGVNAYVLDTGIRFSHADFGGRAVLGFDAFGGNGVDCNGHGTHVAGTIGGATYGVAKAVRLHAVRVLNCSGSGTTSGVIAGVDWVTANNVKPAVANMSLGGSTSNALDAAVRTSIASGVQYSLSAGNGNVAGKGMDACKQSPARVVEAMTVGATDSTDTKSSWSNQGNCVDFFAPGVGVLSAWSTSNTATNTISGTSMAAPHAAGVAALFLQGSPTASAQQVRDALYAKTTKGIVANSKTANNHLLFTDY